jgi:hypothetical protein
VKQLSNKISNIENNYGKSITEVIKSTQNHNKRIVLLERELISQRQELMCYKLEKQKHLSVLEDRTKDLSIFKYHVQKQITDVQQSTKIETKNNANKINELN